MAALTPASRILVAVDFSTRSHRLLRYAATLASSTGGEVEVLHVVPGPAAVAPDASKWDRLAATTLKQMIARARLAASTPAHVLRGGVAQEVLRFASANGFDLVLLSARARPGWNGSLLGGTAEAIARHADVPVLIVPAAKPRGARRKAVS